jgi:hypothetical protein
LASWQTARDVFLYAFDVIEPGWIDDSPAIRMGGPAEWPWCGVLWQTGPGLQLSEPMGGLDGPSNQYAFDVIEADAPDLRPNLMGEA